jgi:DNA repair protein RecO (recombination protein O)
VARLSRTQGLVLRIQDYAETDRIAVLLTPDRGRLDLLAKGARRLERTSGAALDFLNLVRVIFYLRRGLALLREVELLRTFPRIREELERLEEALVGLQWARSLAVKGEADPRPFKLTLQFLEGLERGWPPRLARLAYCLRLLAVAGHGPHLAGCVACGQAGELFWAPDRGGLLCGRCGGQGEPLADKVVATLRGLASLPPAALPRLQVDEETQAEVAELLSRFLEAQLARSEPGWYSNAP